MKVIGGLVVLVLAIVVGAAILVQLRGPGTGAGSIDSVDVVMEDMRFTPNRLDARVGVPLVVRLTNRGNERHDLQFPSLHMPGLEGVESTLEPGQSRTFTLQFDQPGTHAFMCTLPGHAEAGMTGAVFVRQ